jgi:hypothetical protein
MRGMKKIILFSCLLFSLMTFAQSSKGFQFVEKKDEKKIEVLYKGKLLTAYCYFDSVFKPFLFPLVTTDGITVTRGYPIAPRAGERTDHPHHTGMWMNYESVNGLDFWNNSTAIIPAKRNLYGTIRHDKVLSKKASGNQAVLSVSANWFHPDGHVLMKEITEYVFTVKNGDFIIDRSTTLTAHGEDVVFKDAKDGFFAIRVARELEMPSTQADVFVDAKGNKTSVPQMNNAGVTGMYYSSEGIRGDSVWSSKGRWCMLKGTKDGKQITIGIIDHPSNPGYPAYWHARGYGLFAVNPLGKQIFSNGKETFNFSLHPNASVNFKYRVLIRSGKEMTREEMNKLSDAFGKKKSA